VIMSRKWGKVGAIGDEVGRFARAIDRDEEEGGDSAVTQRASQVL